MAAEGRSTAREGSALSDARKALLGMRPSRQGSAQAKQRPIPPARRAPPLPTSEQQRDLWSRHQSAPQAPTYNMPAALRLRGPLDTAALREALRALVARHEGLRTRFGSERGVPYQIVDAVPDQVPIAAPAPHALAGLTGDERWRRALALAAEQIRRPFDLAAGPLFRCWLARLGQDDHLLAVTVHHIVADEESVQILLRDLGALYEAATGRTAPDLPDLPITPADHAAWQRRRLAGGALQPHLNHWHERLAGLQNLDLPTDRSRPTEPSGATDVLVRALPAESISRRPRTRLPAVLTAALCVVLARYTGQDDLAVGLVSAGRGRAETEPMVGSFTNTLVLRVAADGNATARDLLARCDTAVAEAEQHAEAPLGTIVEALRPERVAGRNPLFQISLDVSDPPPGPPRFGGLAAQTTRMHTGASHLDLALRLVPLPDGGAELSVEYSTELFDRPRIERFVEHLRMASAAVTTDPDRPIHTIDILPPTERELLTRRWNPPAVTFGTEDLLLHDLIAPHVAAAPEHPAVRFEGADLTYGRLGSLTNRLARVLQRDHRVGPDVVVGFLLDRGPNVPVAQLSVLKAGGAWLPLDPAHPGRRIAFQLSTADARVVITTRAHAAGLPPDVPRIVLDAPRDEERLAAEPDAAPPCAALPGHVAYVIFTSGSTGEPKGVQVTHRAAVNFVGATADRLFSITPEDRVLLFSNPTFDVSVFDLYAGLCSGATCVAAPISVLHDPRELPELMRREAVTVADIPPAVLGMVEDTDLPHLRALFVGIEAFSAELVNRWRAPTRVFHNGYGPTETTVACVDYECPPEPLTAAPPIGRAMANSLALVTDRFGNLVPIGVPGELCVAGAQLARGYLKRPGLTAERFVPCPYGEPGGRMYRTGDVVRWRDDGELEFIGRVDRQVKIRGLRIELGEVERTLGDHPDVRQAAVVVTDTGAGPRLDAYLTATGHAPAEPGLRAYMAERLPLHMVPATFTALDALPLTSSGKLDHKALPRPKTAGEKEVAPLETQTQRRIADIWRDLIGAPGQDIGRRDNFFTIGGSSLDMVRFGNEIRSRFGVTLEPNALYLAPTIETIADLLDGRVSASEPRRPSVSAGSPLLPLRAGGTGPPLFLVHPVGGSVAAYPPLVDLLDPHQPVYAFEFPDEEEPPERVEDLAARYVEALHEVQPAGPYRLGGWSAGGVIAYEMACRLRDAGEDVALLALLDPAVPEEPAEPLDEAVLLASFAEDLALLQRASVPRVDAAALRARPAEQRVPAVIARLEEAGLVPRGVQEEVRRRFAVFATVTRVVMGYRPRPLDRPVVVIEATESTPGRTERWSDHAQVILERVPGSHYTMLQPPFLQTLADTLRGHLKH